MDNTTKSEKITNKKRKTSKGHTVDLYALKEIKKLLEDSSKQRDLLIEYLHKIQDYYGHISSKHLVALAYEMNISVVEAYEVASFYHHFDVLKEGELSPAPLTIRVCESLSCSISDSGK